MNRDAEKYFLMSAYEYKGFEREECDLSRSVCIAPYQGAHKNLTGVVVTIDGSPPKGTFLHQFGNNEIVFYFGHKLEHITAHGRDKKYYDAFIFFLKRKGVLTEEGRVNQNWKENA